MLVHDGFNARWQLLSGQGSQPEKGYKVPLTEMDSVYDSLDDGMNGVPRTARWR